MVEGEEEERKREGTHPQTDGERASEQEQRARKECEWIWLVGWMDGDDGGGDGWMDWVVSQREGERERWHGGVE